MKRLIIQLWLFALVVITGCSKDESPNTSGEDPQPNENPTISLADENATEETRALYANLWAIQQEGTMFGHHDDLLYGRNWLAEQGRSDIQEITGDYPAVYSVDLAEVMDPESALDPYELNEDRKRTIIEAFERGEVITAIAHLNNPATGGDAWDNSGDAVTKVLQDGSQANIKFKRWLDNLANFAQNLTDANGVQIPLLFRPFHEHNQTWSWWGQNSTTEAEFVELWRFTVDYLKNEKEVHNLIYAISPQLDDIGSKETFLFRWPGDDYVDFIGMDSYHGTNTSAFSSNLRNLSQLSREKMKPCGVTETGIEGIRNDNGEPYDNYWTQEILPAINDREISMIIMWRNEYDPEGIGYHYYAPFPGHSSVPDFMEFYESSETLFSSDLPEMYKPVSGIEVN